MSTVLILTPVIVGGWPAVSAAAAGAAAALGFAIQREIKEMGGLDSDHLKIDQMNSVEVEVEDSEVVAENLHAGQELVLTRDNVILRVRRDERGRCSVCAEGVGYTKAELKHMAEEYTQVLSQHFVYNRVMQELKNKNFNVVNQEVTEDKSIHIQVRRWVD
jgi:hypothetical protein